MDRSIVHTAHMAINMAHRFVYFVPEAAEEYAAIGVTGRTAYFASRTPSAMFSKSQKSAMLVISVCHAMFSFGG